MLRAVQPPDTLTDAAVVVTEVMIVLGLRGHDVKVTAANGPRLMELGEAMLAEFGLPATVAPA